MSCSGGGDGGGDCDGGGGGGGGGVVYQAIIEPPQLTLFNSVLDWVVAILIFTLFEYDW